MENRGLDQKIYNKIAQIMDAIRVFFNTRENLIFHLSLIILFVISAFFIFTTALTAVPMEISNERDATLYYRVAEAWLNGQVYIHVQYNFGISILEILAILFGSIFSLDPLQSLIVLFSIVGCINLLLLAALSRIVTRNKWSSHLAIFLVTTDFPLVYLSVRPLTDGVHVTLILLVILLQIKLLELLNGEKNAQKSSKMPLLAMILGICSGILITIRHPSLVFLSLLFIIWAAFIFRSKTSMKRKTTFSLITLPAILITFLYLLSRCIILGSLDFFFYFGGNSNLWFDTYAEKSYYAKHGLPNPTLQEYLQTHSLNYMLQRELLGIFHIFKYLFIHHFTVFLFFLALGAIVLFKRNYRLGIILFAPIFYLTTVYGWFWLMRAMETGSVGLMTEVNAPIRWVLPMFYIFHLFTIYAIHYLSVKSEANLSTVRSQYLYVGLAVLFMGLYLIMRFSVKYMRFMSNGFDFSVITAIIAFALIFGLFTVVFYPKRIFEIVNKIMCRLIFA